MLYRNIKTGAEMMFGSKISSPDWIPVERFEPKAPKEAPKPEPPKAEPIKEDPPKEETPKKEAPKAAAKKSKSAPKKRTKK